MFPGRWLIDKTLHIGNTLHRRRRMALSCCIFLHFSEAAGDALLTKNLPRILVVLLQGLAQIAFK